MRDCARACVQKRMRYKESYVMQINLGSKMQGHGCVTCAATLVLLVYNLGSKMQCHGCVTCLLGGSAKLVCCQGAWVCYLSITWAGKCRGHGCVTCL